MAKTPIPDRDSLFRRTLAECRGLYVSSATLCAHEFPHQRCLGRLLGRRVRCPKCKQNFVAEWGEFLTAD